MASVESDPLAKAIAELTTESEKAAFIAMIDGIELSDLTDTETSFRDGEADCMVLSIGVYPSRRLLGLISKAKVDAILPAAKK